MKQELMTKIMQQMLPYLDNAQMKQLRQVMEQVFFHYEVTGAEVSQRRMIAMNLWRCSLPPNGLKVARKKR